MYYCKGNLARALVEMFPNIGLVPKKLVHLASALPSTPHPFCCIYLLAGNYWDDPKRRRKFFIEFAKEKGFNPLVAENWYSVPPSEIKSRTVREKTLKYINKRIQYK
jgi:hypothetical protein